MNDSPTPDTPTAAGRAFAWGIGVVLIVGLAVVGWVGVRGALAVAHLAAAQHTVRAAMAGAGDLSAASTALDAVRRDTSEARALTGDPVWSLAAALPWFGPQLAAISTTTATLDDVVSTGLEPLAAAASDLSATALRPKDGAFDVARIASLRPLAATASARLRSAEATLSLIDTGPLLGPLRDAVVQARDLVATASDAADAVDRASRLLPAMLGGDGARSYLVLFQNNAEWRSLGGIVGAMAQIDVQDGRITLADQASSADFPAGLDEPVANLPEEVRDIYDTRPARYIQNVTQLPDFSVGAPIAREMWKRVRGPNVDGVITLDPVALGYILRATGPLTLPTGDELTADNAVSVLLHDVYERYPDPAQQDEFFRVASAAVFAALADGRADPKVLVDALGHAGTEGRLRVWNADAQEQAVLDGTPLQGGLPVADASRTTFGVYFNDGTGSKMDYYLRPDVDVSWCGADSAVLSVGLANDAPDPTTLPSYVTGGGQFGVPPGQVLTGVYVYLPTGAQLEDRSATTEGVPTAFAGGADQGRQVIKWSVRLAPGEQARLLVRVSTPLTAALGADVTPTVDDVTVGSESEGCRLER